MTEADEITPEEHQGAIDWAHSVQKRNADLVMGELARRKGGTDDGAAYLEELRKVAIAPGLDNDIVEILFRRELAVKVSEFDEPEVRKASADLVDLLTKTMTEASMSTGGRKLLVSSLASGQINALCAATSWDSKHYFIFVDSDLSTFCNVMGKIYAECLARGNTENGQVMSDERKIERTAVDPEIQKRVIELFVAIVLEGTPRASKPWHSSAEAYPIALQLSAAISMFPIAHELGHLNLNHLESENTRQVKIDGHDNLEATLYPEEDEFRADIVGSVILTQTMLRLESGFIYSILAPYIFLKSVEILDSCFEVFDEKSGMMSFTHPSAAARAEKIGAAIALQLDLMGKGQQFAEAMRIIDVISYWLLGGAVHNLKL